jgi:GR25 family glycosyltransferase involved in LPS biosynthesis
MKIGAIIIHSSKYTNRKIYVDSLLNLFRGTEVEVNIIEGVFTDKVFFDAREGLQHAKVTKGHIGCSLAHNKAQKLAIEKDYDFVYIFEDDVEVKVTSYSELKHWIQNIHIFYDMLLLTNVGIFADKGHDGREHFKVRIYPDLYSCSCIFGTQAYYVSKEINKLLYETQKREIERDRIFLADGLQIHCEKSPGSFLNIITPINENRFFKHEGFENSILRTL